jgi:hypothetical protein
MFEGSRMRALVSMNGSAVMERQWHYVVFIWSPIFGNVHEMSLWMKNSSWNVFYIPFNWFESAIKG